MRRAQIGNKVRKLLSLDGEYNQPSQKVIQIGAAVFDVKNGQILEKIEIFVNPFEPIAPHITDLTGITDLDVGDAITVREAYLRVKELHKRYKCFKNPLVWGAGAKNDSQVFYQDAYKTEAERLENENFMGYRVIDTKGIYQSIQLYHDKSFSGTLKEVCDKVGIGFEGKEHQALSDAINNFRLWYFLIKEFPRGFK